MSIALPDDDLPDDATEPQPKRSFLAASRRAWVIEALKEGQTHPEIAAALGISRERVRQIAKEALAGHSVEPEREHVHVQIARLTPALKTARAAVAEGNVAAITPLLRILDKLDAYQARVMKLDIPALDAEAAATRREFTQKLERIQAEFRAIGLADQVQTLAETYAATQVLAEGRPTANAPSKTSDGPFGFGEAENGEKANWEDLTD